MSIIKLSGKECTEIETPDFKVVIPEQIGGSTCIFITQKATSESLVISNKLVIIHSTGVVSIDNKVVE
jgi:hypothetical protein